MKTILILTVGGSHQPIVTSIRQHRPDFVHFLCSDDRDKLKGSYYQVIGDGNVLKSNKDLEKPDLPNIKTLSGLSVNQFELHKIAHFDDLNGCYLKANELIQRLHREYPNARLLVDYTGGTKSMTAGLAVAALDDGRCEICVVIGLRTDLDKVQDQTEFVRPIHVWDTQALRRLSAARELIVRYDYWAAEQLLREIAARFASEKTLAALQRGIDLCHAFDVWDKFDHTTSRRLMRPYKKAFTDHWRFVGWLAGEDRNSHGFELIEDLLWNAERRYAQGRYDDAVGRAYRAIEMTAQVWLARQHAIDTSDVTPADVPETVRTRVEQSRSEMDGKYKIGLLLSWDVIAAFTGDPIGQQFGAVRQKLLNFLSVRNSSLFAHGSRTISRIDYEQYVPAVKDFLNNCISRALESLSKNRLVVLEQLPTDFLEISG